MNPDSPQSPREELELRLTALLLGELPDAEAAALRETLAHDPELAQLHDRLAATLGLIREATPLSAAAEAAKPEPLTLDPQRREVLLKLFKKPADKIVRPAVPFWTRRRRELAQLAAMIVASLITFVTVAVLGLARRERQNDTLSDYVMEKVGEPPATDARLAAEGLSQRVQAEQVAAIQFSSGGVSNMLSDAGVTLHFTNGNSERSIIGGNFSAFRTGPAPLSGASEVNGLAVAAKEKPVALGLDMVTDHAFAVDGGGRKPGEAPAKPKELAQLQDRELFVPALREKTAIALPEPAAAEGVTEYRKQAGKEALGKDLVALGNPVHWTESGRLSSGGMAGGGGGMGGGGGGARGPQAPASPAPNSGVTTYDLFAADDSAPTSRGYYRGIAPGAEVTTDSKKDAKQLADGTAASYARDLGERGRARTLTGLAVDAPTMPADGVTLAGRAEQNKIPVIGDLPPVGRLFRNESKLEAMGGEESLKAGGQPAAGQANNFGVNGRGETTLNFSSQNIDSIAIAKDLAPYEKPEPNYFISSGGDVEAKQKAPVAGPSAGEKFYFDANRNASVEFGREAKWAGVLQNPTPGGGPNQGVPASSEAKGERAGRALAGLELAKAKAEPAPTVDFDADAPVKRPTPLPEIVRSYDGTAKQDGFNLDAVSVTPQGNPSESNIRLFRMRGPVGSGAADSSKTPSGTVSSANSVGLVNVELNTNVWLPNTTPATGGSTIPGWGGNPHGIGVLNPQGIWVVTNSGGIVNNSWGYAPDSSYGFPSTTYKEAAKDSVPDIVAGSTFQISQRASNWDDYAVTGVAAGQPNGRIKDDLLRATLPPPDKKEHAVVAGVPIALPTSAEDESRQLAKGLKAESPLKKIPSYTLRLPPAPAGPQPSGIPPQGGTVVNDPYRQESAKFKALRPESDANGRETEHETLRRQLTRGTSDLAGKKQIEDNLSETADAPIAKMQRNIVLPQLAGEKAEVAQLVDGLSKSRDDAKANRLAEVDKKLGEVEMLSEDPVKAATPEAARSSKLRPAAKPVDNLARLSREKQAAAPEGKPIGDPATMKSGVTVGQLEDLRRITNTVVRADGNGNWTTNVAIEVTAARNVGSIRGVAVTTNGIAHANDYSFYNSMAKTVSTPAGTAGTLTITELAKAEPAKSPSLWQRLKGAVSGNVERTAHVAITKDTPDGLPMMTQGDTATFTPYFVEDQADKMQSDKVLNGVIDKLDLKSAWAGGNGGRKLNADQVLTKLRNAIEVRPGKGATDFDIVARSDNPEEAARIANAIAEVYRQQQQDAQLLQRQRVLETYSKEMAEVSKKMGETLRSQQERKADPAEPETPKPVAKPPANAPIPQPEISATANAFSTFSLNVSDVSFKLAAASLEKGVMPDVTTLRAEEFLNALDYHDPEPTGGARLAFTWERARDPFAHDRDYLRFSVKTAASGRQAGRPLNLVLLLDNSGSMERADRVLIRQECLRVLAGQLQAGDRVSVIAFARTARLFIDGLAGEQAAELPNRVGELTPEGGTNLEDAMNLAWRTAARHYLPNGMNRVVLLTDGAANLGDVDPASLKKQVEAQRKQGMALDCFGIGWDGYNDDLLEALSRNGDGRYGFINTPEAAAHDFAGQLAGALKIAASDVKVQVEWNPRRVTVWRQIGYAKHQLKKEEFRDNKVDAAEIAAQEAGNALYTVQVNPAGEGPLGVVRVRYKIPGTTDYREHEWPVPYEGAARPLEQGSDAMRLAATSSAFSEWLASSPFAGEVTPDGLLGYLNGVPERYAADPRPKQLEGMIRQARSLVGK